MFIGRTAEGKKFESFLKDDSQIAALIYGRRRIGKTELIKHEIGKGDVSYVYYECKETSEENNVKSIAVLVGESFNIPVPSYERVEDIMEFIFSYAGTYTETANFILVLDEYTYLRKTVKGLDSILQSTIDKYREKTKVKIIICGSFIDTMKTLLEKQNPLYGRIDLTIKLEEMNYYDSAGFYKGFSKEDKVRLYSVFGGVPYYNRLIDNKKSVKQNIIDLIASDGARLENEVSMNLKSELSKIENANEVLEALSRGYVRFGDILSESHVTSSPTLADVLEKLSKMEIVEKVSPINEKNNRKKTGYYIKDRLSLFYYKYIFMNSSRMKIMDPEMFYERFIEQDFEAAFVPKGFEKICTEFLILKNISGELEELFDDIGSYYYDDSVSKTNGQFDIVTHDPKGYIFYEVKFHKKPVGQKLINDEIKQVKATGFDCYKYGFFSRSGYEKNVKGTTEKVCLYELDDLYKDDHLM